MDKVGTTLSDDDRAGAPENQVNTTTSRPAGDTGRAHTRREIAARGLYDAECALHVARQTHVDQWICAAADHLHEAVIELLESDQGAGRRDR